MAVFNVAGYITSERRRLSIIAWMLPNEDNICNKFRIWTERHIRMRKPYQLSGWTKTHPTIIVPSWMVGLKTHPTIVPSWMVGLKTRPIIVPRPVFELTTSRTIYYSFIMAKVFSNMAKVSPALNHSAVNAVVAPMARWPADIGRDCLRLWSMLTSPDGVTGDRAVNVVTRWRHLRIMNNY